MAWFSSDRAISEYAQEIWDVPVTSPAEALGRRCLMPVAELVCNLLICGHVARGRGSVMNI